jgi:lysophospholipase L1-like esterase
MVGLYSCKPNLEGFIPSNGDADFSSYVSIGNSLTAGYADGALSRSGQTNSFSMMLSDQFALAGGGDFKVPYLPAGNGNNGSGATQLELQYVADCQGTIGVAPVRASGTASSLASIGVAGPYNALGIPGARSVDAINGFYSSLNPYLSRMVSLPGSATMLSEALRLSPTFFILWLGNNDILGYANGGGVGNVDPSFPFPGDLTDPAQVEGALTIIVDSLTKRGAQGVIANVPDVTSIPYFTTIPWNGVILTQGAADTLNLIYQQVGHPSIIWKAGANPFIIEDTTVVHGTLRIRQARPGELILLTTPGDSIRCAQWGVSPYKALADAYVLDEGEVAAVKTHTQQINTSISNLASTYNIALADMNTYMKSFTSGIVYNGVEMNASFISGGAFSLDGVHPNARGYSLIANQFIKAINAQYNSTVPEVDVTSYSGIVFPD